jgi:hypothetical protein
MLANYSGAPIKTLSLEKQHYARYLAKSGAVFLAY